MDHFPNKIFIIFGLVLGLVCSAIGQTTLQQQLMVDIKDQRLDNFSLIEAAFILSGTNNPDSLKQGVAWYDSLVETIQGFHLDSFDRVGTASKIFSYLHSTWLITYREKSTTLLDIIQTKEYNCVAGTILYNLVCSDLGLSTAAFETPTHVYTIFTDFSHRVMVENTSSMGFDIMNNLHAYSRYLAQFYPQKQIYQIGLDRLYAYENSKGREITNLELLGLLAYNRAYFAKKKGEYSTAYDFVLLAQDFNRDSRSNVNFEIDLYYHWGKVLFDERKFTEAFSINADATYRYPFNEDFSNNCEAAFANAMLQNWQKKNWRTTRRLVADVMPLNVLSEKTWSLLQTMLTNWTRYFEMVGDNELRLEALDMINEYIENE